jgi:hypothetical protein
MQPEPTHADIEAVFLGLLDGRLTRDEVDRWASQWIATDDPDIRDSNTRWALEHLYGIDLTHGGPDDYLHPMDQITEWLNEFRERTRPSIP